MTGPSAALVGNECASCGGQISGSADRTAEASLPSRVDLRDAALRYQRASRRADGWLAAVVTVTLVIGYVLRDLPAIRASIGSAGLGGVGLAIACVGGLIVWRFELAMVNRLGLRCRVCRKSLVRRERGGDTAAFAGIEAGRCWYCAAMVAVADPN